jgi:hypothetical protein
MQSNLHHLNSTITKKKTEKAFTDFNRSNTPMQQQKHHINIPLGILHL